jgi:hypothetical protein
MAAITPCNTTKSGLSQQSAAFAQLQGSVARELPAGCAIDAQVILLRSTSGIKQALSSSLGPMISQQVVLMAADAQTKP